MMYYICCKCGNKFIVEYPDIKGLKYHGFFDSGHYVDILECEKVEL